MISYPEGLLWLYDSNGMGPSVQYNMTYCILGQYGPSVHIIIFKKLGVISYSEELSNSMTS